MVSSGRSVLTTADLLMLKLMSGTPVSSAALLCRPVNSGDLELPPWLWDAFRPIGNFQFKRKFAVWWLILSQLKRYKKNCAVSL